MMAASQRSGRAAVAAASGAIAIWSLNAVAGGAALAHLTVLQVLALQFGGAFLTLLLGRTLRRRDPDEKRSVAWTRVIAVGVVGITGTVVLEYVAFALAPLVAANAIAWVWPLLAAAWTALVPRARGSRAALALAVVGFGGVVLLFAARGGGGPAGSAPLLGCAAALGAAFAMAAYTLTAGRSGFGLWTHAMAHPVGARLASVAYVTPLVSTGLLLATGRQVPPLGLVGCALILLCVVGVIVDALLGAERRRRIGADRDLRVGLAEAAARRSHALSDADDATTDLAEWAIRAHGVIPVSEVARIAGLSRESISDLMRARGWSPMPS
jgi:drug/metabolite transporter (DMT)-like permease